MSGLPNRVLFGLVALLLTAAATAQSLNRENLVGHWEFTAYSERSTPDERVAVGVQMEIRADGTVLTTTATGITEDRYRIDGNTLIYIGAQGEQVWTVRAYSTEFRQIRVRTRLDARARRHRA